MVRNGKVEEGVGFSMDTVCLEPRWIDGPDIYREATVENGFTITEQVKEIRPTISAAGLAAIICPRLLMIDGRSGNPFTETLDRLEELITDTKRVAVPDASHLVNQDNPSGFISKLRTFIAGVRTE